MTNILEEITQNAINALNKKLDSLFIDGLERKGFKFENNENLISFIKDHVVCHDHQMEQEKIYFVDGIPFLLHKYKMFPDIQTLTFEGANIININAGEYSFL